MTATVITGIISLIFGFKGLIILGVVLVWSVLCVLFFERKIRGITGDVLGASNEISEIIFLLMALVLFG
ncbi:MAG: adenosylcobinamide-GDP ribazoletransferase [Deltaproteobacteria bacterium]|nr:adenosylcobinamide-GDP ribazoletransferase [Deltaproteobacteria bacterium]